MRYIGLLDANDEVYIMLTLVIGTPDSGKSNIAEKKACSLCDNGNLYYLATMIAYDEDGKRRIKKHRSNRLGKGFATIEIPYEIDKSISQMSDCSNATALLECISNLAGNEMFENPKHRELIAKNDYNALADIVIDDIKRLYSNLANLVIVTNDFSIDESMDEETIVYIRLIKSINERLINIADEVISLLENSST